MSGDVDRLVEEMELPDEVVLVQLEGLPGEGEETLSPLRVARSLLRFAPHLLFAALPVFIYLLISLPRELKWFGACMALAGVLHVLPLIVCRAGIAPAPVQGRHATDVPPDSTRALTAVDLALLHMYRFSRYFSLVGLLIVAADGHIRSTRCLAPEG